MEEFDKSLSIENVSATTETVKNTAEQNRKSTKSYAALRQISADSASTVVSNFSDVVLKSPDSFSISRYGRARKPRLSEDFYCSDEAISPMLSPEPKKISIKNPIQRRKLLEDSKRMLFEETRDLDMKMDTRLTLDETVTNGDPDIDYNNLLKIVSRPSLSLSPSSPVGLKNTHLKTYSRKKNFRKTFDSSCTDTLLSDLNSFSWTEQVPDCTESKSISLFNDEVQDLRSIDIASPISFNCHTIESPFKNSEELNTTSITETKRPSITETKKPSPNTAQLDQTNQISINSKSAKDASVIDQVALIFNDCNAVQSPVIDSTEYTAPIDTIVCPWQVGDLIWSRVGNYPLWPCVVALDPILNVFKRQKVIGKHHSYSIVHVRFFGDGGRRSWVSTNSSVQFQGKTHFDQMAQDITKEMRRKDPKYASGFDIRQQTYKRWIEAVEEAESLLSRNKEERLTYFEDLLRNKKKKSRNSKIPTRRTAEMNLSNENQTIQNEFDSQLVTSTPLKKEKTRENGKTKISKIRRLSKKVNSNNLRPSSYPMRIRQSVIRYDTTLFDEVAPALIESLNLSKEHEIKTEEDACDPKLDILDVKDFKSEPRSTPSPALCNLMSSKKKKNIFKGAVKEKLCQLCEKPSNVFKCKGNCFRFYHHQCVQNPDKFITDGLFQSSIYDESSNDSKESEIESDVVSVSEYDEIIQQSLDLKIPADNVDADNQKKSSGEDGNIRRKKSKPKTSLSIAEQIDAKMEEVMRSLGDQIKYADTSTEESCAESDNNSVYSQIIKPPYHITGDSSMVTISLSDREFKCQDCLNNRLPACFVCNSYADETGSEVRQKCCALQCGRVYHPDCLRLWPQAQWTAGGATAKGSKKGETSHTALMCPYHVCHTCVSDDPRGLKARFSNEKMAKCIRCPTTYHASNYCIPAGSEILSSNQIVCPKHFVYNHQNKKIFKRKSIQHVNASWCFICAVGGSLICCETCPTSFHAECLRINPPEGSYICEDCETGRLPLYDEIVWVKLGIYRWWPAQILFPSDIPENLQSRKHNVGEFAVKFFGSHDYYWVNRGRVFLYQEGDTGHSSSKRSIDGLFVKAIEEAAVAYKLVQDERESRRAETKPSMKPPPYTKIRSNRPVGNVRIGELHTSSMTPCDCDPHGPEPCGVDSDCLNRLLLTECNPSICPAGENCRNQAFEKREYPQIEPFQTTGRGWGLKCIDPLVKGQFVIEYVGEMINEDEYKHRIQRMHEQKDENYYFLTIDKDRMLDAGPKGNVARFMNHSCQPNCETQKWTVNGDTRVGLFAVQNIPPDTELTFNYNLESIGKGKKICRCGAPTCSGFIGLKAKPEEPVRPKRMISKKRKSLSAKLKYKSKSNFCFKCGEKGPDGRCCSKKCWKTYHLDCVDLSEWPREYWWCPRHTCQVCSRRKQLHFCSKCIRSYCSKHAKGNFLKFTPNEPLICSQHKDNETKISTIADIDLAEISSTLRPIKKKLRIRPRIDKSTSLLDSDKINEMYGEHRELREKKSLKMKSKSLRDEKSIETLDQTLPIKSSSLFDLHELRGHRNRMDKSRLSLKLKPKSPLFRKKHKPVLKSTPNSDDNKSPATKLSSNPNGENWTRHKPQTQLLECSVKIDRRLRKFRKDLKFDTVQKPSKNALKGKTEEVAVATSAVDSILANQKENEEKIIALTDGIKENVVVPEQESLIVSSDLIFNENNRKRGRLSRGKLVEKEENIFQVQCETGNTLSLESERKGLVTSQENEENTILSKLETQNKFKNSIPPSQTNEEELKVPTAVQEIKEISIQSKLDSRNKSKNLTPSQKNEKLNQSRLDKRNKLKVVGMQKLEEELIPNVVNTRNKSKEPAAASQNRLDNRNKSKSIEPENHEETINGQNNSKILIMAQKTEVESNQNVVNNRNASKVTAPNQKNKEANQSLTDNGNISKVAIRQDNDEESIQDRFYKRKKTKVLAIIQKNEDESNQIVVNSRSKSKIFVVSQKNKESNQNIVDNENKSKVSNASQENEGYAIQSRLEKGNKSKNSIVSQKNNEEPNQSKLDNRTKLKFHFESQKNENESNLTLVGNRNKFKVSAANQKSEEFIQITSDNRNRLKAGDRTRDIFRVRGRFSKKEVSKADSMHLNSLTKTNGSSTSEMDLGSPQPAKRQSQLGDVEVRTFNAFIESNSTDKISKNTRRGRRKSTSLKNVSDSADNSLNLTNGLAEISNSTKYERVSYSDSSLIKTPDNSKSANSKMKQNQLNNSTNLTENGVHHLKTSKLKLENKKGREDRTADLNQNCTKVPDEKLSIPVVNKPRVKLGLSKPRKRKAELELLMATHKHRKYDEFDNVFALNGDFSPRTLRYSSKLDTSYTNCVTDSLAISNDSMMDTSTATVTATDSTSIAIVTTSTESNVSATQAINGLVQCISSTNSTNSANSGSSMQMSDCNLPIRKRTGLRSMVYTLESNTADS